MSEVSILLDYDVFEEVEDKGQETIVTGVQQGFEMIEIEIVLSICIYMT